MLPLNSVPSPKTKRQEEKKAASLDFVLIFKPGHNNLKQVIVITKKVAPKAVDRNRIKRVIKEDLRNYPDLKGEIKIVVKVNLSGEKLQTISAKLRPLLKKIK